MKKILIRMLLGASFIVCLSLPLFVGAGSQSYEELINRIQSKLAYTLGAVSLENPWELSQALFDVGSVKGLIDNEARSTAVVSVAAKRKLDKAIMAIEDALKIMQKDWGSGERRQQAATQRKLLESVQKSLKIGVFDTTTTQALKEALDVALESFIINLKNNLPILEEIKEVKEIKKAPQAAIGQV
ncbi:TPA: hypothetical protein DDZ86_01135 [Candidatus Dependentiae bacterium]|nr:MAG: hypothetical protein UW09_C0004G0107 [candidate division TM6 bacterium GW2011_GWF2_43_87]HBL98230.1 hypothetical protein [Candidatus Dependentiae bacterium]